MEENTTRKLLQSHRVEMMAYLEDWLWRLEESLQLPQSPKLRQASKPHSHHECGFEAEEPRVEDAPLFSHDSEAAPVRARSNRELDHFDRMDSYQLATLADRHVSEAFDRVIAHSLRGSAALKGRSMCQKFQQKVSACINSPASNSIWTFFILTNSIYLGVHLEITALDYDVAQKPVFFHIHLVYAILFTLEVILRLIGAGNFFRYIWGPNWHWNILDMFVVISSWVEMAVDFASGEARAANTNLRILRVLRIGRIARVLRIVRVVRLFRALRTLVASLMGTLKSLFWSFLLLGLVVYIFGILFLDVVLDYKESAGPDSIEFQHFIEMSKHFGDLGLATGTLFRSISNGISWKVAADSLQPAGDFWFMLFHFYVAFCSFALLNVMTGVFCNSAIKAAENDTELMLHSIVQMRKELREHVVKLFHSIDERGLGRVTISDFEKAYNTEAMQAFLHALQLGAVDAWTLFTSLDKDGDFEVSVDEFTERCLQLHGPAKSVDLFAVRMQNVKLQKQLSFITEQLGARRQAAISKVAPQLGEHSLHPEELSGGGDSLVRCDLDRL